MLHLPRLQLIAPFLVRLKAKVSVGLEDFEKGVLVTMEKSHAEKLIASGKAEAVDPAEGLEGANRFDTVKPTTSKAQSKLEATLNEIAKEDAPTPLPAPDDAEGDAPRISRTPLAK